MRVLYSLLIYLATPAVLLYMAWRGLKDPRWRSAWRQRFALDGPDVSPGGVVVHAASVGEVNAAAPLVSALLNRPDMGALTISSFTPTGAARARALFGDAPKYVFAPLDLPGSTRRFFRRLQPRLLIVMETEIWPNLYHQASAGGIPVILANARLSERSVRGYKRYPALVSGALEQLHVALAQSEADGQRLLDCGMPPENLRVAGNLKYDIQLPDGLREAATALRERWGAERPVIIAASTHEEDDAVVIAAFREVQERIPGALLILVPRHPERFGAVAELARKAGLASERFSEDEACSPAADVFLVDVMGKLVDYYACSDLAIIGGSFGATGGHNPLEPAALGLPLICGPDMSNFGEVAERLREAGAMVAVANATGLAQKVIELMGDPARREQMANAGRELVASGRGALQRTLAEIDTTLN